MIMKKVLLFLAQGFEELEAAAFIDVIGWTHATPGAEPVELVTSGLRRDVRAAHSLMVRETPEAKDSGRHSGLEKHASSRYMEEFT